MLEVACSRCERRGRLQVDLLVAQYGDAELPELRLILAGDAIHRVAAALCADQEQAPFQHRQIGAMAGCLLAGVDIDPVPAAIAPGAQQQIRPGRAAERA